MEVFRPTLMQELMVQAGAFKVSLQGQSITAMKSGFFKENAVGVGERNNLFVLLGGNINIFVERQDFLNVG